ncbi:hypothetical protein NDI85_18890 [Halomicroarcula sp. S1AR25-4]|uniref:hypothetical protein n=1 Tax=Haloarcula sp. S1AR25-4 TaxID=2950538 RepID=UPI0028747C86|nr:hypothetical protein [Halomicroarcula sp. S1AR25-4]MDS0279854.1 hypothetical protein [Halomicroarcula sp. S1AR25-4]
MVQYTKSIRKNPVAFEALVDGQRPSGRTTNTAVRPTAVAGGLEGRVPESAAHGES